MSDSSNVIFANYKIIAGDSTDSKLFGSPFIDLTVTSPPYNVGMQYNTSNDDFEYDAYLEFSRQWMSKRILGKKITRGNRTFQKKIF